MKERKTCFKDEKKLDTLIQAFFGVMMMVIVGICLCLSWILYAKKRETLPNIFLLPAGLAAVFAFAMGVMRLMRGIRPERRKTIWIVSSIAALLIQIVMVRSYYFYTDWDVETIVE